MILDPIASNKKTSPVRVHLVHLPHARGRVKVSALNKYYYGIISDEAGARLVGKSTCMCSSD